MPQTALLGALLAGLLGGVHCVAMCGGWLAVLSKSAEAIPLLPARSLRIAQIAAHAGRLFVYGVFGALSGAAGGAAYAIALGSLQQAFHVAANLLLLSLALSLAFRGAGARSLERLGLAAFLRILPLVPRWAPRGSFATRFGLGMLWGATPCALVYGVLPVAMFAGSAIDGALVMLAFGMGTLPNLLAAGLAFARAPQVFRGNGYRYAAASLVAAFAVAGIYRAVFAPEALAQSPFCLTG